MVYHYLTNRVINKKTLPRFPVAGTVGAFVYVDFYKLISTIDVDR